MTEIQDAPLISVPHPTDMLLPHTADEITAEWMTRALAFRYPGIAVTEATVVEVIAGTSTKVRVRVGYNDVGVEAGMPERVIVKGAFDAAHRADMGNMYLNEMRYYRDGAPWVEMNVPATYYAGRDPETNDSVIIIEDLSLRDVRFLNAYLTQGYEQVARRLDAMARYHAQTWNSAEFAPGGRLDWVPVRYEGASTPGMASVESAQVALTRHFLSDDVWQSFMDLPRGAATPKPLRDVAWMRGALEKMAAIHSQIDTCLIHGDTHMGNLYEEQDGTPGFFDMPVARAPWSMEFSYHVIGALEVADRRAWERPLLAYYLERLRTYGVDAPSFEEGWEAYCRDICHGLFIWLINENHWQPEAINTANATRFGMAALECGTREILS